MGYDRSRLGCFGKLPKEPPRQVWLQTEFIKSAQKSVKKPSANPFRDLTILAVLTLALHLPFLNQAFHLDDIQYLELAQNVFRNFLFPMDLPSVFEGQHLSFWGHTHPPLNGYVIAS